MGSGGCVLCLDVVVYDLELASAMIVSKEQLLDGLDE